MSKAKNQRGFTIMEVMLATLLASIIIMTAFALLAGVGRATANSRQTAEEMIDLQRVHGALEKAFRLIVTAESTKQELPSLVPPDRSGIPATPIGANSPATPRRAGAPTPPPIPTGDNPIEGTQSNTVGATVRVADRLIPGGNIAPGMTGTTPAGGATGDTSGQAAGDKEKAAPQSTQPRVLLDTNGYRGTTTLEMVLSEPPVALPYGSDPGLAFAMTRGGFVLKPPPMRLADGSPAPPPSEQPEMMVKGASQEDRLGAQGYELLWETYSFGSIPGPDRDVIASVRLAGGVRAVSYAFYKTSKETGKLEATGISKVTGASDLPAYVEVEVSLTSGKVMRWFFEIGWTTGPEPDIELNARLAAVDGIPGATDAAGNPTTRGSTWTRDGKPIPARTIRSRDDKMREKLRDQGLP